MASSSFGILEGAPDAMVAATVDGTIVYFNSRAEDIFGYTKADVIGQKVESLMPARFRDRHIRHREAYATAPRTRPMGANLDLFGLRRDGVEFPAEIGLSMVDDEGQRLVLVAIRDVSDRMERRRTADLISYNVQALRSAAETLAGAVGGFGEQIKRGVGKNWRRQVVAVAVGVVLGFELLIQASAWTWTCDPQNLALTQGRGSIHKHICHFFLPTTKSQERAFTK